jgi:hypothetical protein
MYLETLRLATFSGKTKTQRKGCEVEDVDIGDKHLAYEVRFMSWCY